MTQQGDYKDMFEQDTEIAVAPSVRVLMKKVYGNERFYPSNSTAKTLCQLMKVQTFTKDQLKFCKDSGWKVSVQTEEYVLE
jgi:hypothetical protein